MQVKAVQITAIIQKVAEEKPLTKTEQRLVDSYLQQAEAGRSPNNGNFSAVVAARISILRGEASQPSVIPSGVYCLENNQGEAIPGSTVVASELDGEFESLYRQGNPGRFAQAETANPPSNTGRSSYNLPPLLDEDGNWSRPQDLQLLFNALHAIESAE